MTDTKDSTPLDYEAIHGRACALRNTAPGFEEDGETPYPRFLTQDYNTGEVFESDEHQCPPPKGREYAGCVVYVADGQELLTIATNEGEQMPEVADAICSIGADVFALLAENKMLRAKLEAKDKRPDMDAVIVSKIRVSNLRSAGFVNDPTAVEADVAIVFGDVVTPIGVATVCYAGRRNYPAISFGEEASARFETQDDHDADDVLKAIKAAVEVTDG